MSDRSLAVLSSISYPADGRWAVRPVGWATVLIACIVVGWASATPTIPAVLVLVSVVTVVGALVVARWPIAALSIGILSASIASVTTEPLSVRAAYALSAILSVAAVMASWGRAPATSRRGVVLIASLGLATLTMGALLAPAEVDAGVAAAVAAATAVGCAAACVRPAPAVLAWLVASMSTLSSVVAISSNEFQVDRGAAVLGQNANGVGFLAALGLVCSVALATRRLEMLTVLAGTCAVVNAYAIYLSGSRGALAAGIVGIGAVAARHLVGSSTRSAAVVTVGAAVGLYASGGPVMYLFLQMAGRDTTGAGLNLEERQSTLRFALEQGLAHPLTGVGLGQLENVSLSEAGARLGLRAHNVYAGLFAEAGIIPAALLLTVSVLACLRGRRHSPGILLPIIVTVLVGGLSLEWWGSTGLGPMAMLVLGTAVVSGASHELDEVTAVHKASEHPQPMAPASRPRGSSRPSKTSIRTDAAPFSGGISTAVAVPADPTSPESGGHTGRKIGAP